MHLVIHSWLLFKVIKLAFWLMILGGLALAGLVLYIKSKFSKG